MKKITPVLSVAILLMVPGSSALAQNSGLDLPFFRDLWAGKAFETLPEGMPDPMKLRRSFESQPRVVDWAIDAEREVNSAISRIKTAQVTARSVRCHSTICEAIFLVPDQTITSPADFSDELERYLGAAAMVLGKQTTMAQGGGREGVTGVLVYFHDDGVPQ